MFLAPRFLHNSLTIFEPLKVKKPENHEVVILSSDYDFCKHHVNILNFLIKYQPLKSKTDTWDHFKCMFIIVWKENVINKSSLRTEVQESHKDIKVKSILIYVILNDEYFLVMRLLTIVLNNSTYINVWRNLLTCNFLIRKYEYKFHTLFNFINQFIKNIRTFEYE